MMLRETGRGGGGRARNCPESSRGGAARPLHAVSRRLQHFHNVCRGVRRSGIRMCVRAREKWLMFWRR